MSAEVQAALVAAGVALVTSGIGGFLTLGQLRRERTKWLVELKTAYATELYKKRLEEYPKISVILQRLSSRATEPLTPAIAEEVAAEINTWFYSTGGLCADQSTRGALLGLRETCLNWRHGPLPDDIWAWRDAAIFTLRRDLDLQGLESFAPEDRAPLLESLQSEMKQLGH
jgi:hypothetical protein